MSENSANDVWLVWRVKTFENSDIWLLDDNVSPKKQQQQKQKTQDAQLNKLKFLTR